MDHDKIIEAAAKASESKKKELERSKALHEAATKVAEELKAKLTEAESARKAAEQSVESAEAAAKAALDVATVGTELAAGKQKQAALEERERSLARAKDQGASAETLAALEQEVAAAKAEAPSPARMKELAELFEKHQQSVEAARARGEWEKRLGELTAKEPAALQRQTASLAVLKKAVVEADQASAALTALKAEIESLRSKLEGKAAAKGAAEKPTEPRPAAAEVETVAER